MPLLDSPRADANAVLVTGGTGLVGSMIAATLLDQTTSHVVLPVRAKHAPEAVTNAILEEVAARGRAVDDALRARLHVGVLPEPSQMSELVELCRAHGVDEIVHAAGSVDYFNAAILDEVNVKLTSSLLDVAAATGCKRFTFVSTAFSSGFCDGPIAERLHDAPDKDPTEYTKSKRDAERLVAQGGVPWVTVRPSVIIGDSVSGRYHGKPYGVYQFYAAGERLLLDKLHPEIHIVGPRAPLPVVHQDAFCAAFLGAHRWSADSSIVHAVSQRGALPTMRDVLDAWLAKCIPFERVYIYERLDEVPMAQLSRRMRMWAEFSAVNTEIALRTWAFETTTLDALRARGVVRFTDATTTTLQHCLDYWLAHSERFQLHCQTYADKRSIQTQIIEVPHATRAAS